MKRTSLLIAFALVLTLIASSSASAQSGTPAATMAATMSTTMAATGSAANIRNTRYCEVLPVALKDGKIVASVYNTIGHSDCPDAAWKALDVAAIKKQFNAVTVTLNGPRYWVMDQIIASGASKAGETVTIGGLVMTKRAEVVVTVSMSESTPYQIRDIQRDTEYVFQAGKPVYELVSADGNTYVMQTYSQQIDPTLTIDGLLTLGTRLKLPTGWKYQVVTLDKEMHLSANGVAHLIQDDLANSYQRVEPHDLGTPEATTESTTAVTTAPTMAATAAG